MKKHKKVKIKRKVMRKKMNKHSKHIKIKPKNKEIIRIVKPQKRSVTISKKIENVDKTKSPETETKYTLEVDGAKVTVEIKKEENSYTYNLNVPKFSVGTESLLRYIKNELISSATISVQELSEQESFFKMKQRFLGEITSLLKEKLPHIEKETENLLAGILMQDMLGLGNIEFLINDQNLEEIVIQSSKEPIRVYSKKYGWLKTNIFIPTEDNIINYANIIARRVGRQITVLDPLLDAHLLTGDRINAVLYPINSKGSTIIVRKFSRDPYTIIDLIKNKTCSLEIASLLWVAVEYEMNILVSGGTASGKTSFLNACMPFIPPNHRIISIEDTRELVLPDFLYWNPLVTRTSNSEGKGKVTMLDLLVNSLRMRPDRIILGEMRKHEEAMVLFEAMHTGHSVYATVHADSAPETISRLTNPPISIPANLLKAVNLNVVMFRDRKKGIRRISQVAEFDTEGDRATSNIIYRWVPEKDQIIEHRESTRFFEDLSRHTGLSESEIKVELNERKKILEWLIKNDLRSIKEVGNAIELFYQNKDSLMKMISKNEVDKIKNK
jgi:flagellar protein FlaI